MDQPGAEMFAGLDNADWRHVRDPFDVTDPKIALEISKDGKQVTLKIENDGLLLFATDENLRDFSRPIGGITWKQEIVFDLNGEDAVVTDTHIGQNLNPNIVPRPKAD